MGWKVTPLPEVKLHLPLNKVLTYYGKKAQKKEKKNKTSDVINKIIPHCNPFCTFKVCKPWKVPSRITSRHHWIIEKIKTNPAINNKSVLVEWNHFTSPKVKNRAPKDLVKGQGLIFTKW